MGIDAAGGGRGRQIAPCIMQSLTLVNNCRELGWGEASSESVLSTQCFPHSAHPICPHGPTDAGFTNPTLQARAVLQTSNSLRAVLLA